MADTDDPATLARHWLRTTKSGVLSTISTEPGHEGWPFGSIVPFALSQTGVPHILIASIAMHTKNLVKDPRYSLLVHEREMESDPQAGWRITLLGRAQRLAAHDDTIAEIHARYLERVPAAESYLQTHGFDYWRLDVDRVRFIGGFGKIAWIDAAAVMGP